MAVALPAVTKATAKPSEAVKPSEATNVPAVKPVRARVAGSSIEQALTLRDTLRAAAQQAGDLARSLKQRKRQSRFVASTLASLQELQRVAG